MEIKYIMMTCDNRNDNRIKEYKKEIPNLIINHDDFPKSSSGKFLSTAWNNYLRGWELAGDNPSVQFDDDIILTSNFINKLNSVIKKNPNDVIQFFSMRKDDLTIGTRYVSGSKFMMQQCYYLPKGVAKGILSLKNEWYNLCKDGDKAPTDLLMAEYFKRNKINYLNWCPNLVDHIVGKSAIDSRRSSKRQSKTFKL